MAEQLPLLTQYERIKSGHRDEILFFRLGDFYEMFFSDAVEASSILNLTLTHRQDAPMCGVPHHAARGYIARLLRAGKKVAICEQMAPPGKGKGIIERAVVEVVTPGSVVDDDYLVSGVNNFLVAFGAFGERLAFAYTDASTGELVATSFPLTDHDALGRELFRLAPREAIVRESLLGRDSIAALIEEHPAMVLNRLPDWTFSVERGWETLIRHFGTKSLRGFGFEDDDPACAAAGALLDYVRESMQAAPSHIRTLRSAVDDEYVIIDEASQKNLEIDRNLRDGSSAFTLFDVVNQTRTPMGARMLRQRLQRPLRAISSINARLDEVECLYMNQRLLERVRGMLGNCRDLERLAARIAMGRASPRDFLAAADTVSSALLVAAELQSASYPGHLWTTEDRTDLESFAGKIRRAIAPEPAMSPADGPVMHDGWDSRLDSLRALKADAHGVLEAYLEEERAATGLSGLRVRYNRIIGYYLELNKASAGQAPAHFIRRQSISTGERFTTERLGQLESDINGASERIVELEKNLFDALCKELKPVASLVSDTAAALAAVDCAASGAWTATTRNYSRPTMDGSARLDIQAGRHPVVEAFMNAGSFVPNDLVLDGDGAAFALITGPNMAGKSTFLRQAALIVLLAQAGQFVPATSARIGSTDRIFCRVGAQDNLARGESTFLLEMHETAGILNNAGARSLVIMDEVGRGTGTLDGLSIAWAVSEHVLDVCRSRTLFATHYHELTSLRHPRLFDLSMAVEERKGDVVFLKRVVAGPAAGSYGIHVARLAGIPEPVIFRAGDLRKALARDEGAFDPDSVTPATRKPDPGSLFSAEDVVIDELRSMDTDRLTPLEALTRLAALKKMLSGR